MRRVFLVATVVVSSGLYGHHVWGRDTVASVRSSDSDLVSQNIDFIRKLTDRVKVQGYASIQDNISLRTSVELLLKDKVIGITAAERQKLVKETIGADNYVVLQQVFLKQLGSSDMARQESALRSLGYPLFALDAADELRGFVFNKDRRTQLLAIESLVYLDITGANYLLQNTILTGILHDFDMAEAIYALYVSNDKDLDRIAVALTQMNIGGRTFKSLLPVLRKRADYHQILARLFKSNLFFVPEKEELDLEERAKVSAEWNLLDGIFSDPAPFMADMEIKKKVMMCASSRYELLNTIALLVLEKAGEDVGYFTEMLKDDKLTPDTRKTLELIISRIQNGRRLK